MVDDSTIAMADSFMAIFGFRRKAIVSGNVITPVFNTDAEKARVSAGFVC